MASEANKIEVTRQVKCSPHKFYEKIKYTYHHLPTVLPEVFKSSDIIEGDGKSVGTVRLWKYVLPGSSEVLEAKEKIESIDDENMWVVQKVLEGNLVNEYNSFLVKIHVIPEGEGCLVKWSIEYGECGEGVSDPHHYLELFKLMTEKLGAHIVANV